MKTLETIINKAREEWPPIFAATEIDRLSGGALRRRTIANLRCKGEIPENDSEKYSLYFWLTHPNGESKQIIVDPILKSNTKTTYSLILNYLQNFDFGNLEGVKTLRDGLLNIIKS